MSIFTWGREEGRRISGSGGTSHFFIIFLTELTGARRGKEEVEKVRGLLVQPMIVLKRA